MYTGLVEALEIINFVHTVQCNAQDQSSKFCTIQGGFVHALSQCTTGYTIRHVTYSTYFIPLKDSRSYDLKNEANVFKPRNAHSPTLPFQCSSLICEQSFSPHSSSYSEVGSDQSKYTSEGRADWLRFVWALESNHHMFRRNKKCKLSPKVYTNMPSKLIRTRRDAGWVLL